MKKMPGKKTTTDATPKNRPFIRQSYLLAALFTLVIGLWMLSGDIIIGGQADGKTVAPIADAMDKNSKAKLFRVAARTITTKLRTANLLIRGQSEADARVSVRAQTAGMVIKIMGAKGSQITKGQPLCLIDKGVRESMVLQARAQLAQDRANYKATERLAKKGRAPQLTLNAHRAKYDAAVASVNSMELDLERTTIVAPFTGILEEQSARVGDYLNVAGACAMLVAIDPLVVTGQVSERDISKLQVGMTARTHLVTGEDRTGKIRFISPSADAKTRTFRIEIEIDNKASKLRDGVTADIVIPLKAAPAHLFSPNLLTLNAKGEIGVRTVDKQGLVHFIAVDILEQSTDGVWVAGLPAKVTLITTGQEYVVEGQKVEAVMSDDKTKPSS